MLIWIVRFLYSLRYKVVVNGLENLPKSGLLFLSNHVGMESTILGALLWPRYKIRPLAREYPRPWISKYLCNKIRVIEVPVFKKKFDREATRKSREAVDEVAEGLKKGENFLVFPSGRLKTEGREWLEGVDTAQMLIQKCPNVNVVLVRVSGFWGSWFSLALDQNPNKFTGFLRVASKVALKNFIFFTPKRKIQIDFVLNPPDFPRNNPTLNEMNQYLENWYNQYGDQQSEPLTRVSYSLWGNQIFEDLRRY